MQVYRVREACEGRKDGRAGLCPGWSVDAVHPRAFACVQERCHDHMVGGPGRPAHAHVHPHLLQKRLLPLAGRRTATVGLMLPADADEPEPSAGHRDQMLTLSREPWFIPRPCGSTCPGSQKGGNRRDTVMSVTRVVLARCAGNSRLSRLGAKRAAGPPMVCGLRASLGLAYGPMARIKYPTRLRPPRHPRSHRATCRRELPETFLQAEVMNLGSKPGLCPAGAG